ncbi:hypothetical protein GE061_003836 [Apolygus lucorum]|uniref:Anaphase-promoting complex subunit 4-like WD40 domain-containing protein n=1 Tax=Apolygus lucorum TaxID=248454 RepID=A0A6A4JPL1_APOLU|nr:hypothetical protein GE061_003836 [Apolygus lucorum]
MSTEVHSVRFYQPEPSEVKCLASDDDNDQLAVARADNSIEIWNISTTPHVVRTILDTYGTVESLAWFEKRLFSVGLQGSVIEYDMLLQNPKTMHPLTSGSGWCVAVHKNNKQLAAGTEDGYINVFDISSDEIIYNRLLDKQEGRVQCLAWDHKGEFIVTGSVDTVRVWQVSTGHAIHRMTTGRSMNNLETRVWAIAVAKDFTIITGDSRGKLCFWDGKMGISIASYQSHKADVLSVCVSKKGNSVHCAGVDPLIASYERVKMRGSEERRKWVKSIHRVIHEHDVRSLVLVDGKLFSAGVDGYLAMSSYPPKMLVKYPPLLQSPSAYSASRAKCLLLRYPQSLVLWKLGGSEPSKLLEWQPRNNNRIRTAALASNAKWMAVSTQERFGLFSLVIKEKPTIAKCKIDTKDNLSASCLSFSHDASTLGVATIDGDIYIIGLDQNPEIKFRYRPLKDKKLTAMISHLVLSNDGLYTVAADLNCNIIIWAKGEVYSKLPTYTCSITAMSIQPSTNNLIVVYADHKIVEYSLMKRKYTSFSRRIHDNLPAQWLNRSYPVHTITFDSRNDDIVMLGDDSTIMVINKKKELPVPEAKIPRISSGGKDSNVDDGSENSNQHHPMHQSPTTAFHVIKKYKHLVHFGELAEGEIVAVEISPLKLLEKLPSNFRQKKFGRM